jgi:hypothetical protein
MPITSAASSWDRARSAPDDAREAAASNLSETGTESVLAPHHPQAIYLRELLPSPRSPRSTGGTNQIQRMVMARQVQK